MNTPPPADEQARLQALRRYAVLDTPPEDVFDRITRLAAQQLRTPIALIALLDERRQWFKAARGLDVTETERAIAFCDHTIRSNDVLVVPDARRDPRFAESPLVTGAPWVRFYAGAPLITPEGARIGTLAVIDTVPRTLEQGATELLASLAVIVIEALELRLARQQLEAVIANAPIIVFVLDREGIFTLAEGSGMEALARQTGPVLGRSVFEVYAEIPQIGANVRRALSGETVTDTVEVAGTVYDTRYMPLRDAHGEVVRVIGVATDVTARARTDQALRESQERLARIIETIADGITIVDAEGRFVLANIAAERLLGVPRRQLLGATVEAPPWKHRTLTGEPLPPAAHPFRQVQRSMQPVYGVEYVIERMDGTAFVVSINAAPLFDATGAFAGVVSSLTDVTDRKQAEHLRAELLAREQEARAEAERTAQHLRHVQSILDAAFAQAGDADAVLQALAERVAAILRVPAATVRLFDAADGRLHLRAANTIPREEWAARAIAPGQGVGGRAFAEDRAVYVRDIEDAPWPPTPRAREAGIRSVLAIPMRVSGRVIGVLTILTTETREFTPEEVQLLEVAADRAAAVAEQTRLYAAERQARQEAEAGEQRLAFLTEASAILSSSLDYQVTLERLAHLAVPFLADWCIVDIVQPDGTIRRIAGRHADPKKDALLRELERRYPPRLDQPRGVAAVIRRGQPTITPEVTEELLASWSQDEGHLALLRAIGARTQMCVPLMVRDTALGALSFLASGPERRYGAVDLALAEELARRAAVAIENAHLYEAEQAARQVAEAGERRLRFLSEASLALTTSLDPKAIAETLTHLAVPTLADRCTIHLLDERGEPRWVGAAAESAEMEELLRKLNQRYPLRRQPANAVMEVIRTGQTRAVPAIPDARLVAIAQDADHLAMLRALGNGAAVVVPLRTHDRTIGALTLRAATPDRVFGPGDIALAEELGRRAALALENARLHTAEQEARQAAEEASARTARLQAITAALSEAVSPAAVTGLIVRHAVAALGASGGSVFRCMPDGGPLELVSWHGYPDELAQQWRQVPIDAPLAPAEAARTGEMIVIGSRQERAARFPPRRPELETGSEAFVIIPLASEGRVLGVLHLGFDRPRQFGAEDRAFMQALGQQCAQALERARLQEEAAAAAAALETERFKTDLLNTVSHELRTPLAAIKGFSSAMLMFGGRMPEEEQRGFLTEIDAAADRLTELVDNLLDLARLESGSFQIVTAPIDLAEVLAAAVAESRVRHPERTITLELVERPLPVNGDTRRLRQVAANLLDNALKYSPNGGPVQVSAAPLPEGGVTFSVQDHGIGIPAVHIGKLFQRFYRVDTGLAREIGGTGLGLAICRRIVEEHGGQITVSSTEGEGSTFTVTLPGAPSRAGHHTG